MNTIALVASGIVPTCTGVGGGWRRTINTKISAGMIVQADGER